MIKFDIENRVAVVTGGAQGFGLAITERFIESGAKVVIWDIDENEAKKAMEKVKSKNLSYNFLRLDKEKSIQIFNDSGWHFNNILTPEDISLKLRTFAHSEFADKKFSSIDVIENKIKNKIDLFDRGHKYQKVEIDNSYPEYLTKNLDEFKDFII